MHRATPGGGARGLTATLALVLALSACGGTGQGGGPGPSGGSGQSVNERITTATVCLQAASAVSDAASIAVKLATSTITPSDAQQQLGTIQVRVDKLASQNASLPIGMKLKDLSTAIGDVRTVNPTDVASVQTPATEVSTAATAVIGACAAAGG